MTTESKYQIVNGALYKKEVPGEVIKVLEETRHNGMRITITYGDTLSGKVWKNNSPLTGYVSLSHLKLPILVIRKKSGGGECIKDASILEISEALGGKVLYAWAVDESLIVEEVLEVPIDQAEPEEMTGT